jgi:hypothetical protein
MSYKIGRHHARNGTIRKANKYPTWRVIVLPDGKTRPHYERIAAPRWNRRGEQVSGPLPVLPVAAPAMQVPVQEAAAV